MHELQPSLGTKGINFCHELLNHQAKAWIKKTEI